MSELQEFRAAKDDHFARSADSPLTAKQKSHFMGLIYYTEAPDLVFDAKLDTNVDHGKVRMQTSTGSEQIYRRAGIVRFEVDGRSAKLTLYESEEGGDLFVPFKDATSGKETYGAGRYLEVRPPRNGRVHVDFNYAYNPYCAYNEAWSCPLPPTENWLSVPIRAGEKSFPSAEASEHTH
jgi:uncharacterized protein (DUF1684 family)